MEPIMEFVCNLALMAALAAFFAGYAGIVPAIERAVRRREVKRAALDAWNRTGRLYRSESESESEE